MPPRNIRLEDRIFSTFLEMLEMKIGQEMTLQMKDTAITLRRVK
ncbi:MAG: hypothetical protein ACYC6W_02595 [Nitrosotalea sp.]|jgi:hypothetical protein